MPASVKISNRTLQDLLDFESEPAYSQVALNGAITVAQSSNYAIGTISCPTNRAFYIETMEFIASTHATTFQAIFDNATHGGTQGIVRVHVPAGGTVVVPVRQIVRQAGMTSGGNLGSVAIRGIRNTDGTPISADLTAYSGTVNVHGRYIYDDLDIDANKVIFGIGDSIFNNVGGTTKNACWVWGIHKYYESQGIRTRVSLKSKSGSTSGDHAAWFDLGLYDSAPTPALFIYELMTNDAGQGVPTATYLANMQKIVNWARLRWPNAKILITGTHGLENDASEANAAAMRTAAQSWVAGLGDSRVKFLSLAGAFDRKVSSNFASTDTAGQRVHPSDAGRAAIQSVINAWLPANFPTI